MNHATLSDYPNDALLTTLGKDNIAFVIAVDIDGNMTVHPTGLMEASIVNDEDEDEVPKGATILKNVPSALLVFKTNPRCIRKTIGGTTFHFHT